ncbi:hypothetical protein [Ottowia thiooxydans]|uniref:hypothetical protein n=1 Tax=Ottowia thiooxydans TaxID=219182 RepID=UPI00041BB892|nr:hypothetical protein [Ottowia thiooxydans]
MNAVAEKLKALGIKTPLLSTDTFATDAWGRVCEAEAVLRAEIEGCNTDFRTNGLWGVMFIIGSAANDLERFHIQPSYDDCWGVLRGLEQATGILDVFGRHEESLILNACGSLIGMAESRLKAGMENLRHA